MLWIYYNGIFPCCLYRADALCNHFFDNLHFQEINKYHDLTWIHTDSFSTVYRGNKRALRAEFRICRCNAKQRPFKIKTVGQNKAIKNKSKGHLSKFKDKQYLLKHTDKKGMQGMPHCVASL
jgi:hypothetical protein